MTKLKIEQYANGRNVLLPGRSSETAKPQHTRLNNDGALSTPQPSLLLSLPLEIRLQIWQEATYAPSSIIRPLHPPSHRRREPADPTVYLTPLPISYQNTLCNLGHAVGPFTPPSHNPRTWLFTCRQIYAEARPLVDIHPPSLHFCHASAMNGYLKLAPSFYLADSSIPNPQGLRSLSLCLFVGIKSALGGRYALAMSDDTGWEGGHGDEFCDGGCKYCGSVRGMPRDLGACFPELRTLKLNISFKCVGEKTEEMIISGRKTMEEDRMDDKSMYENRMYEKSTGEKSMEEKSMEEKSMEEKSMEEKRMEEKSVEEKRTAKKSIKRRISGNTSIGGREGRTGGFVDDDERVEWIVEWICKQLPLWGFVGKRLESVEVVFKTAIVHHLRSMLPAVGCWCVGREVDEEDEMRGRLRMAIKRTLMKKKLRDDPAIKPRGYPF